MRDRLMPEAPPAHAFRQGDQSICYRRSAEVEKVQGVPKQRIAELRRTKGKQERKQGGKKEVGRKAATDLQRPKAVGAQRCCC